MSVLDNTHEVLNQAPPLVAYNVFEADLALREALEREGGGWGVDRAARHSASWPARRGARARRRAERNEPILRTHDRYGNRIDEVELDPSWHWLLRRRRARDPLAAVARPAAGRARGARRRCSSSGRQVDAGVMCPISMTYSAVPALRETARAGRRVGAAPDAARATSDGALCGMAMTEKQGGSDVRANTTRAEPLGDGRYEITGHKWFCSYPPCDVFLMLAQAPAGLSCFLVEGRDPGFQIQRLKDKLGTRSLPSSRGGVPAACAAGWSARRAAACATIIRMVNHTRLDCLLGSAAGMRRGRRRGRAPRPPPLGVRQAAGRAAGDAERAGRPGDRVRGRHRGRLARRARLRRAGHAPSGASPRRS